MRKTKVVCTLGPAADSEEIIRQLICSGMNAARFNFSHGTHESHLAQLTKLKRVRDEMGVPVATILDTKGPEVRLKSFAAGSVMLRTGQEFTLTTRDIVGDEQGCSITYADLPGDVKAGDTILLDDGLVRLTVLETTAADVRCRVENGGEGRFRLAEAERNIRRQFGEEAFDRLPRTNPAATMALGGLLHYLYETQKTDLSHINDLDYYEQGRFMELDLTARRNLELTETLRDREKRGSLLWVLDKTRTPMGGRLLRSWLERPLLSVTAIAKRNAAVAALVESTMAREELIAALTGLGDMERLIGRIVYGTAGMLDGVIDRIREQFSGRTLSVVATGGNAPVIVKYCRNKIVYDKYLLMDGLWAIYQKNK